MKNLLVLALSLSCITAMGQLRPKVKCPDLYVDVLNGTVNSQKPNYGWAEIKENIPCYTSASEEGKCGPTIVYKDKDVIFYTKRHYIEIGSKFVGKFSIPVLGTKRGSLFKSLGNPSMKDDLWDAYQTAYGLLILRYDVKGPAGKVRIIQMSTESTESIQLCE